MNKYSILGVQMSCLHEYRLIQCYTYNEKRDGIKPTKRQVIKADKIYRHNNPRSHRICGVPVTIDEYQRLIAVLQSETEATGINPTKKMVREIVNDDRFPLHKTINDMRGFDKEMRRDE